MWRESRRIKSYKENSENAARSRKRLESGGSSRTQYHYCTWERQQTGFITHSRSSPTLWAHSDTLLQIVEQCSALLIIEELEFQVSKTQFEQHFKMSNSTKLRTLWQAGSRSALKEISHLIWNPTLYYRVHNSHQICHILSQMNPLYVRTSYCFEIRFNIILQL
jgi:hypothetical protein